MNRDDALEFSRGLGKINEGKWELALHAHKQGIPKALGLSTQEWAREYLGPPLRLAIDDRRELAMALSVEEGLSNREIAGVLGVSEGTVRNDLGAQDYADAGDSEPANAQDYAPDPRDERREELRALGTPDLPAERYRCIVIDPPWPMGKIEREVRPNQGADLEYPVMPVDDIQALPISTLAAEDGAHLYLWVTQRFLPDGMRLMDRWGFRYQCLMTWLKPGGMTPYSWQYNTEHVLFGTRGNLPLTRLGLKLGFAADRDGHSVKPDEFYQRVVEASPEPRIEMFARRPREGFAVWGNEV